jgi:hypothetical protein
MEYHPTDTVGAYDVPSTDSESVSETLQAFMRGKIDGPACESILCFNETTFHIQHTSDPSGVLLDDEKIQKHRTLFVKMLVGPFGLGPNPAISKLRDASQVEGGVPAKALETITRELSVDMGARLYPTGILQNGREDMPFLCSSEGLLLESSDECTIHLSKKERDAQDAALYDACMAGTSVTPSPTSTSVTEPSSNSQSSRENATCTSELQGKCAVVFIHELEGIGTSLTSANRAQARWLGGSVDDAASETVVVEPRYTDRCVRHLAHAWNHRVQFSMLATGLDRAYVIVSNVDGTDWNGCLVERQESMRSFLYSTMLQFARLYLHWAHPPRALGLRHHPESTQQVTLLTLLEFGLTEREAAIATSPLSDRVASQLIQEMKLSINCSK